MSETNSESKGNPARRRPSALALAKMDFSVRAEIGVDDVQALRPSWTEQQAQAFLRAHGHAIGEQMATAGAVMLVMLIEGSGGNVN